MYLALRVQHFFLTICYNYDDNQDDDKGLHICQQNVLRPPGSDEAGVRLHQEVGDIVVGQVQHDVSRGLRASAGREAPGPQGTHGHHGQPLALAAQARGGGVLRMPLGAQQEVADQRGDVGVDPQRGVAARQAGSGEQGWSRAEQNTIHR